METSTKALSGGLGIMTILMLVMSGYDVHVCEPEGTYKECLRLSASAQTCYNLDDISNETRGDRCVGGTWKHISEYEIKIEGTNQGNSSYILLESNEGISPYWRIDNNTHYFCYPKLDKCVEGGLW